MAKSPIDFFAGGGREYFIDEEENPGLLKKLEKKDFVLNMESLIAADELKKKKKYGFLLAKDGMPKMTEGRGKFLLDASSLALEYLNKRKDPFFMMIEGSQIDWGGHANDAEYVISETLDFDQTIGAVLDFAEKDGNTLVIVTADHETGGFTLAAEEKKVPFQGTQRDYNSIAPSFSTGGHSSAMVPVLAFGPGAENFQGIYQNTEIHAKIKELLK
jgi:alkaline phosphatase